MAGRKKTSRRNGGAAVEPRLGRLEAGFSRLEAAQRDTNTRLGRIEETLVTSSKLFELMHDRLEQLEEGQRMLVEGQRALVEGQKLVIDRLDRLVAATTRVPKPWSVLPDSSSA